MEKKYILKTYKIQYTDGTSNEEHILDIIAQVKMLYENICDNIDICMQVYSVKKSSGDEDLADALSIVCEDAIAIEKSAQDVICVINKVNENISKYGKNNQLDFESLLNQMKDYEDKSRKIIEKVM